MKTVVFDIDGTLADCSARIHHVRKKPKNWTAFFKGMSLDKPNQAVIEICRAMRERDYRVLLCTGRYESHRPVTEAWLAEHQVPFDELRMRRDGDRRQDVEVKREMLLPDEIPEVLFVVEDRSRNVEMYRSLGLVCLQCDEGDF